ncbi:cell wall anchor protein [Labilibaculum manganireducens]|uniref:Cell wall anchor protein n=1 Tax=Labilibaculum manganireducens TaxID=1940525 RepID=A0A2N3I830_9BACT|nr:alginate lyase family protein [Labilibaculum manganireducens]PKQ66494.1 cell wall anchor protein [Labilibaculum manganireducens]
MKKIFIAFLVVLPFLIFGCGGGDGSAVVVEEEKPPVVEEEEFPIDQNKTFIHPGMLHTKSDFDRIKLKVKANAEPWLAGWNMLIKNAHASLSYKPNPVVKLIRGGNSAEEPEADNYSRAFNDVAAAYQCAIRWKITGDDAYADKAVQILNVWASTCERISGNSNVMLAAGIYGYQFANAAEILRDYEGWESADFEAFKQWLLDVFYPLSSDFLVRHNGTCISHYWANWDLANLADIMAVGILTDRADIYNEAIDYLINGDGNGQLKKTIYFIHPNGLGQIQESGRDQGHAQLCIGLLGTICEMAWHQGDDLYGYDDNRVLKGSEYEAKYNFANLSVPFEPYNNCENWSSTEISPDGRGSFRPIWARLYNHYVIEQGLSAPYIELAARVHLPEGGGGDYGPNSGGFDNLGFGTLMYSLEK